MKRDSFFHKLCDEFYKLCNDLLCDGYDDEGHSCSYCNSATEYMKKSSCLKNHTPQPYVVNIRKATNENCNFKLSLWTGEFLQLNLMNIKPKEDIGLEVHRNTDRFIFIEYGEGFAIMGNNRNNLSFRKKLYPGYAVLVPAGTWHNIINIGCTPLKLYSICIPSECPHGTIY